MIDKKALRKQFDERIKPMGIYSVMTKDMQVHFIGSTRNLDQAKTSILFRLEVGALASYPLLQNYYHLNKVDGILFRIEEILDPDTKEDAIERELSLLKMLYLKKYPNAKEMRI